jgi:2-C-methyl-D-erythritol 4-phosphate cytidylyltransferase
LWAVVPAAGVGRRMGVAVPKQYLELQGRPVIEHTLERLMGHPDIAGVYVAVAEDDERWENTAYAGHPEIVRVKGGAERCHSVLNALALLRRSADPDDWVLVHDAARPCLRREDVDTLLEKLRDHPVGGILGVPAHDTMKRTDEKGAVLETVARECLWHAFTPQMFRLGMLQQALQSALEKGVVVTDDAAAMELAGHQPLMIQGHADNIKITRPEDLALASYYLSHMESD